MVVEAVGVWMKEDKGKGKRRLDEVKTLRKQDQRRKRFGEHGC